MATYDELFSLFDSNVHLKRITIAIAIAAKAVQDENVSTTNHVNRLIWAKDAYVNPAGQSRAFLLALLAGNAGATLATINGVTDAAIQSAVNAAVDTFAGG